MILACTTADAVACGTSDVIDDFHPMADRCNTSTVGPIGAFTLEPGYIRWTPEDQARDDAWNRMYVFADEAMRGGYVCGDSPTRRMALALFRQVERGQAEVA